MIAVFVLQLVVPLLLIGWLAVWPARNSVGFAAQLVVIALSLLALALTGLWLFPPWWAPYGFAILYLLRQYPGFVGGGPSRRRYRQARAHGSRQYYA